MAVDIRREIDEKANTTWKYITFGCYGLDTYCKYDMPIVRFEFQPPSDVNFMNFFWGNLTSNNLATCKLKFFRIDKADLTEQSYQLMTKAWQRDN